MYQLNRALNKAIFIYGSISFFQLIYILILTEPNLGRILSFFCLFFIGSLLLFIVSRNLNVIRLEYFESKLYKSIFILTFFSILLTSRSEYIVNTLNYGLASTRLNEDIGGGGLFSIINAMFYPLGMLAVYHKKDKFRIMVIILTLLVATVDIVFMGTRNTPFFIIIYFFIFNSEIKIKFIYSAYLILAIFLLMYAFEFTTRERSGFIGVANEYWYFKATESDVMSGSTLNLSIFDWAYQNFWGLLPVFYMIAYISHSIADFTTFITNYSSWFYPTFAHLLDQLAIYVFSDRSSYQEIMSSMRVRSGYYQTMYTSVIIDLGILVIGLFPLYFAFYNFYKFIPFRILLICFISLSLIENYFIQGLKPLHFLFYIFYFIFFINIHPHREKFSQKCRLSVC